LKSFVHPDYDDNIAYYDVGILVTEVVTFSRRISPVCLPEKPNEDPDKYENDQVELIGWGQDNLHSETSKHLRRVSLKIFPTRQIFF